MRFSLLHKEADSMYIYNAYVFAPVSNYPQCLLDGNTVAWWNMLDETKIVKDSQNRVIRVIPSISGLPDMTQNSDIYKPLYSVGNGILFDGVDDYMKSTVPSLKYIYMVVNQLSNASAYKLFFSFLTSNAQIGQASGSLQMYMWNYADVINAPETALGRNIIIRALINGDNSYLATDDTKYYGNVPVSGDNEISVASQGGRFPVNMFLKEIIIRSNVTLDDDLVIYNYLKVKYNL